MQAAPVDDPAVLDTTGWWTPGEPGPITDQHDPQTHSVTTDTVPEVLYGGSDLHFGH